MPGMTVTKLVNKGRGWSWSGGLFQVGKTNAVRFLSIFSEAPQKSSLLLVPKHLAKSRWLATDCLNLSFL